MIDATLFIGAAIAGATQLIKEAMPQVSGPVTILIAVAIGVLVSLVDTLIGVSNISVAQGIMTGLAAAGVVATAAKVNTRP